MKKLTLPNKSQSLIKQYLNLKIAGKTVRSPYFQNFTHKSGKPVSVGKGLPVELAKKTEELFRKLGKDLKELDPQQIRLCMVMVGLGIDCSGFVLRVLQEYSQEIGKGDISKLIKPKSDSLIDFARHKIKFTTNISANILTSQKNSVEIMIPDVMPSDLIRFGKGHIAIVTEVYKDNENVKKIVYYHSTYNYFENAGVKKGEIIVKDQSRDLSLQGWIEQGCGVNWTYRDFVKQKRDDRGLRRLKAFV